MLEITLQNEIRDKFPQVLCFPIYKYLDKVNDFMFKEINYKGHVGVIFGLKNTGKKHLFAK